MKEFARKIILPGGTVVVATMASLSACSAPEESAQTITETVVVDEEGVDKQPPTSPTTTSAASPSVLTVDFEQYQQVNLDQYTYNGSIFFFHTTGGTISDCFASAGVVTCFGTPDDSVPDVEEPFRGRPGAVQVGDGGLAYTIAEGVPPAQAELKPGQWIDFGGSKCAKPDAASLICASDSAAFELTGEKLNIATEGPVVTSAELMEQAEAQPVAEPRTGGALVRGPIMCGAMEGPRLAEVMEGEITCAEAMDVLDRYESRMFQEGTGNILAVRFDGWDCATPTYRRAMELQASVRCINQDRGITIHDPDMRGFTQ
ncbi:hypothetical protein [Corynebacterium sp.]|uniref:hypothetical protein n=1 Tax=Corynebacterium sp. TaxID=1720 RepID=UPI002A9162FD|nr:hypothetical protein [Corynebacterium sp.]MDY5784945.1 hypothetical protein [Corynebacterium sp.]